MSSSCTWPIYALARIKTLQWQGNSRKIDPGFAFIFTLSPYADHSQHYPLNSRKEARCVTSFNFANMTVSKNALHRYISRRNCDAYFGKSGLTIEPRLHVRLLMDAT
jgi:hypothetical protein